MYTQCPHCRSPLRLSRRSREGTFLCPYCQRVFQRSGGQTGRQLLVALDVSTSAERYFPRVLKVFSDLVHNGSHGPFSDIGIWLFHRTCVPFPCEHLAGPHPAGAVTFPTLRDLRGRVARGTAVLDVLHHMLEAAEQLPLAPRELAILTDGEDRCSRRHPEELRLSIERSPRDMMICMHILTDGLASGPQLSLVRKLSVPRILWSVHPDRSDAAATRLPLSDERDNHRGIPIRSH